MKKGDFLIIAAVIILLLVSVFSFTKKGETVSIYINGELYKEVKLSENTQIKVESSYGTNTVVIKDGAVNIKDSDCPGKDCEKGSIKNSSSSLVCLPNRLTVIIDGEKTNDGTDVVL